MQTFGYSANFGAITEDQFRAFNQAMLEAGCSGCIDLSNCPGTAKLAALLQGLLQAFPDPADRAAIRQRLVTDRPNTLCVEAVNRAFEGASAPSIFKKPAFWIAVLGAATIVGGGIFMFTRRRRVGR